jgi:ubiquinol-cytochrome c reductase cytochrome b subunit
VTEREHIAEKVGAPGDPHEDACDVPLFPDLFISGMTVVVLALCLYSLLCIFLPAGLDIRASHIAVPVDLKPAWYFLFLHRLLRSLPPLAGALVPVVLLVLLGSWPFIDRNPSREPRKRILAFALAALTTIAVLTLSYLGWAT